MQLSFDGSPAPGIGPSLAGMLAARAPPGVVAAALGGVRGWIWFVKRGWANPQGAGG